MDPVTGADGGGVVDFSKPVGLLLRPHGVDGLPQVVHERVPSGLGRVVVLFEQTEVTVLQWFGEQVSGEPDVVQHGPVLHGDVSKSDNGDFEDPAVGVRPLAVPEKFHSVHGGHSSGALGDEVAHAVAVIALAFEVVVDGLQRVMLPDAVGVRI